MDSSTFFGGDEPAPDPQGYDQYGRYLLDADGTGQRAYTRATTLAKTLDDGHGLSIWQQRKAAKGVAVSPALTARAKVTPLDDKKVWREILAQAEVKSGGDEKRDWGSAFHEFHERVPKMTDDEYAAQAVELRVTYERYRAELARLGIEEVLTEFTCVNSAIGTAGKGDAVFRLADGRLVIGDRKTGRVVEYPHSPAVQFAIYANADVLIEFGPNGEQIRKPMPNVDKTIALVVDITIGDEDTAAVHVYEVNIWAGWYGALLAGQVRRWRNRKDLIRPYHPEFPPAEKALAAAVIRQEYRGGPVEVMNSPTPQQIAHGEIIADHLAEVAAQSVPLPPQGENQAWFEKDAPGQPQPIEPADRPDANTANTERLGGPMTQPPHAAHPITKQAWSSAEQRNITLNPDGTRADGLTGPQVSAVLQPDDGELGLAELRAADVDALLAAFKTKAQLQAVLAKVNPGANLARQRKNLAADAVSHPNWPNVRAEFLRADDGGEQAVKEMHERTTAEVFSPVVSNAPGPVPPDPTPAFPVVEHGPATADLTPDPSLNPFRPAAAPPVKTPEDELAERIAVAGSNDEIADIWDQAVNVAGIGWTPRLHQAATIRTKQFNQEG